LINIIYIIITIVGKYSLNQTPEKLSRGEKKMRINAPKTAGEKNLRRFGF
jgi:hypothetical protein